MMAKSRELATRLRGQGYTYSEILKRVPVAKSTLSSWLSSVGLTVKQAQRLTEKKLAGAKRGGLARRNQRLLIVQQIKERARSEIWKITEKDLSLIGTVLYWAEGSKYKDYRPSEGVTFSNSDPKMIRVFLKWLINILKIHKEDIRTEIYLHESHKSVADETRQYWSRVTGFPIGKFDRIYFKRNKIRTRRRNKGQDYHGLLRIRVLKSINLNRKIAGWIEGICIQCGVV